MKKRSVLFWVWACVLLLSFQYLVFSKEKVLRSGDVLLLELVPVDPRSFLQGDYMQLSYAVDRELQASQRQEKNLQELEQQKKNQQENQLTGTITLPKTSKAGAFVVVSRDENKVARVARSENGTLKDSRALKNSSATLAENEWLIPYVQEYGRPYIPLNTFFFQEGQASTFAQACYAVFRCTKEGDCLLVDLADAERNFLSTRAKRE